MEKNKTPTDQVHKTPRTSIQGALLTGAVGAGKTSLAVEIAKVVRGLGGRVVVIDLDWLAWIEARETKPQDLDDLLDDNLRAVWGNFMAQRPTHVILSRFVHHGRQLARLQASLPGVDLTVARVVAPSEIVEERLRGRDVGAELEEHLAEVSSMNDHLNRDRIWDLEIVNDARSIREVALEAVRLLGW